jgi:retron-type reverse transcriptase
MCSFILTRFGTISLRKVAQRVDDRQAMRLLKLILKASGDREVPQGGVISPLLVSSPSHIKRGGSVYCPKFSPE